MFNVSKIDISYTAAHETFEASTDLSFRLRTESSKICVHGLPHEDHDVETRCLRQISGNTVEDSKGSLEWNVVSEIGLGYGALQVGFTASSNPSMFLPTDGYIDLNRH
jgi:hypothetical protein